MNGKGQLHPVASGPRAGSGGSARRPCAAALLRQLGVILCISVFLGCPA